MSQEDLIRIIENDYGFKKELIKNPEVCGMWHIRFEVNGIKYYGSTPYPGALPILQVEGYTSSHYWHGIPVTDDYYDEYIKDKKLVILHAVDPENGDWEVTNITFDKVEDADLFISKQNKNEYKYDLLELYL